MPAPTPTVGNRSGSLWPAPVALSPAGVAGPEVTHEQTIDYYGPEDLNQPADPTTAPWAPAGVDGAEPVSQPTAERFDPYNPQYDQSSPDRQATVDAILSRYAMSWPADPVPLGHLRNAVAEALPDVGESAAAQLAELLADGLGLSRPSTLAEGVRR